MQALISGITGTALLVDGAHFSWLRAGDSAEPAIASPAYVRQFVSRALDAFAMENATVESIRMHLDAAWLASGIVSSVLIALNPDETDETRRLACEDLEESLSDVLAIELAERQLLSSELHDAYEIPSMLGERGLTFCKRLFQLQPSIAATISAFNRINSTHFRQGDDDIRERFLATAVREGLMRLIVLLRSGERKKAEILCALDTMQSLKSFTGNPKIVAEWLYDISAKSYGFSQQATYLLLTGSTGLLGRYLIRDLLESGQRLALVVRGSKRESASRRVESILQYWEQETGKLFPRPVLLEGDLLKPFLGLSENDKRWVADHCNSIMHSAACLTFHADGSGEPWLTNFDGTRNMLELCEATGLRKLHYVSTAYVCGLRPGTMLESEVDCGQTFRNDYEESKLKAEMLVRSAEFIDELTIYRPAVISGDSKTGYTNTYHGIYLYLRLMALLIPRQPIGPDGVRITKLRIPIVGDEQRNVVPVDWVSKAMTHLYLTPEAHGHTFHLTPDVCVTAREMVDAGVSFFNSSGVDFLGYVTIDPSTYNELEAASLPGLAMYNHYDRTDPVFDRTNLKRFAGHLPCPSIDEKVLHTYIQYGEENRWGKKRNESPVVPWDAADYFREIQVADEYGFRSTKSRVALDLIGPGGGQWTLGLLENGVLICKAGFHDNANLLRLNTAEFRTLVSGTANPLHSLAIEQLYAEVGETSNSTIAGAIFAETIFPQRNI